MTKWLSIGLIAFVFGIAYWVFAMDYTKQEVEQQRAAIVKINKTVQIHITRQRYQECYERNIPPEECPPEPEPLPPRRPRDD